VPKPDGLRSLSSAFFRSTSFCEKELCGLVLTLNAGRLLLEPDEAEDPTTEVAVSLMISSSCSGSGAEVAFFKVVGTYLDDDEITDREALLILVLLATLTALLLLLLLPTLTALLLLLM
jgi:hypothetical protein